MPTTCERRLSRMLGLPGIHHGRMSGRVERTVAHPQGHALMGVILRKGLGSARWADRKSIAVLGEVSVILSEAPRRLPPDTNFSLGSVRDSGGMTLGWVTDVLFQPDCGAFSALEISLGPTEELLGGRYLIRSWPVHPSSGQVMIPCGCVLEHARR